MPAAQELPTEILCSIFELSALVLISLAAPDTRPGHQHPPAPIASTSTPVDIGATAATDTVDSYALPSQKDYFMQCITLSHVCSRWRYIAIDFHTLWTRIHLGRNAFGNNSINGIEAEETTSQFFSRSADLLIYLDISPQSPVFSYSSESINRALLPHVTRFNSLRLICSEAFIAGVLDVFLERNLNLLDEASYTPLSHLHLARTQSNTVEDNPDTMKPFFPPDLSVISPHLRTLHVEGVQIAVFPKWRLEYVVLKNTFLSYRNHFHLLSSTRTQKLVLHQITIPDGTPHVRLRARQISSSVVSLTFSELRCIGGEDQHKNMYTTFFSLSFYHNLQELEISRLSREAMSALIDTLGTNPLVALNDLRRLVLREVKINRHAVGAMADALPSVRNMVLDNVEGSSKLVHDIWQQDNAVWPQLVEIIVDGKAVGRYTSN
ncbi:hypothetical protein CPB84DRAFT_1966823 [Gymnopilus junonius]|uniref:F-box domain-containing protein n=1 Tax=Gymnopilus junonius TaxID=109634 RepID=A0A9P5NB47_GYMJU|nr:hypothetical protein CPB84DRAFT_1966823 [Gymnopilus junonius]